MHVDMDAFFAAVEQAGNPYLRGRPVVVGGAHGGRGVVTTASYECRIHGIHSGMSGAEARRLCPEAIFVGVNARHYIDVSRRLKEIFAEYSPKVEPVSVDEAFLDLTGCASLFGSEEKLARRMKEQIREELSLTCSVGIASGKTIAKLASSVFKPDGLTVINRNDIPRLVYPLPVGKLWGVGPVTEKKLQEVGIQTIGDLAGTDADSLRRRCGVHGVLLARIARGEDVSAVIDREHRPREKSIGHEQTFAADSNDRTYLLAVLYELADRVARRMRRAELIGRTVTLKIRLSDFDTCTRQRSISTPTNVAHRIARIATELLNENYDGRKRVRLLGISISSLTPHLPDAESRAHSVQGELFAIGSDARVDSRADCVMDRIRDRHGERAIVGGSSHWRGQPRRHG
jgi:DNA polymerase-4